MKAQWTWMSDAFLSKMLLKKALLYNDTVYLVISPSKKSSDRLRDQFPIQYEQLPYKLPIIRPLRSQLSFDNGSHIYFRLSSSISTSCALTTSMMIFNDYEIMKQKDLQGLLLSLTYPHTEMLFRLNNPNEADFDKTLKRALKAETKNNEATRIP